MFTAFQSNNDTEDITAFSLKEPGMVEMVDIATLNSKIKFDKTDVPFEQRQILGDATETGLARFAGKSLGGAYDEHHAQHPKVFEGMVWLVVCFERWFVDLLPVPFNSTNKWALTIVSRSDSH